MGKQSNSSTVVVGVVLAVVLVVGLFGGLVVVGSLFWVTTSRVEAIANERAVVETLRAEGVEAQMEDQVVQTEVDLVQRLTLEVQLDRDGKMRINGEEIDLKALKERLVKLKAENALTVQINADSKCPVKRVVPVANLCKDLGDVDYRIATSPTSASPTDESTSQN